MYVDPWADPRSLDHVVFADTLTTPGVAKVTGWNRENEYDVKTGKGTAGATETLKGQPPAKGSIEFKVWTWAHMQAWNPILDVLRFDPAKAQAGGATSPTTTPSTASTFTIGEPSGGTVGGTASGTIPEPGNTSGQASTGSTTNTATTNPPALSAASAIKIYHPFLADIGVAFVLPPEKLGQWTLQDDFSFIRTIEFLEFTQPPAANIAATPTGAAPDALTATGQANAGGTDPPAATNPAGGSGGAGSNAQGSWGAP